MTQYYLKLDQSVWAYNDFTDSNTYALTGTIYTDSNLSSAATITGLTLTIKLTNVYDGTTSHSDTADIVTGASGTWRYKPSTGEMPNRGVYTVVIELTTSGTQSTTINRQELLIR